VVTRADAARLLGIAAAIDNRKVTEEAATMWAQILGGLDPEDCARAITQHFTDSTEWLMPAHVRAGVRRIRSERLSREPEPVPDADPDDVGAYLAAQRAQRYRRADGTERARPVAALVAGAAERHQLPPDAPGVA